MLGKMTRKALDLVDELQGQPEPPIVRIETDLAQAPLGQGAGAAPAQIWLAMAVSVSSLSPIARPTSRTARLPR